MARGILLVNLGTPASRRTADVATYLREFLMDGHVLDVPPLLRWLIVSLLILPFRAETQRPGLRADMGRRGARQPGRPCCTTAGSAATGWRTAWTCRWRSPCATAIQAFPPHCANWPTAAPTISCCCRSTPQHADSTRTTTIAATRAALPPGTALTVVPPFYDTQPYLDAQATAIAENLPERWDHLLFSYHGLPERHIRKADPTGRHCLADDNCCREPSAAHCHLLSPPGIPHIHACWAQRLGVGAERYGVSFQSRLGRAPWLTPYTDQQLRTPAGQGCARSGRRLPSIHRRQPRNPGRDRHRPARETFLAAGGTSFTLTPCLNAMPKWIAALKQLCNAGTGRFRSCLQLFEAAGLTDAKEERRWRGPTRSWEN